jgi:hypothetical protein
MLNNGSRIRIRQEKKKDKSFTVNKKKLKIRERIHALDDISIQTKLK